MKRLYISDFDARALNAPYFANTPASIKTTTAPNPNWSVNEVYVNIHDVQPLIDELKACHALALNNHHYARAASIVAAINTFRAGE